MSNELLIEISCEELPAIPFLKELPNIKDKWIKILQEYDLVSSFDFYYTPRRLVLFHKDFALHTKQTKSIIYGPPLNIAYKDNLPTKVAIGFAKKCGISAEKLKTIKKNGTDFLCFKKIVESQSTSIFLNDMVNKFISSLDFGRSMRWDIFNNSFIRPIRALSIVHNDNLIKANLFNNNSQKISFTHPMIDKKTFTFNTPKDYFKLLKQNGVILDQNDRKKLILDQIDTINKKHNIKVQIDEELLNEIVVLTQYPTVLLGAFDEEFLTLPKEVIITSMKEHQRYFSVYKNDKLTNNFIVVSNSYTKDFTKIIKGNEKVLKARLKDSMFFYENDLKIGLKNDELKNLIFVNKLGTMYDKSIRERKIALYLSNIYKIEEKELISKTIDLSYCDLSTQMVFEFTSLQGIIGYYYSKYNNEDERLSQAIKEQYLPNGNDKTLPSSIFSSLISLSKKIDTLISIFSINKIPTGSKDPFALRRACIGILEIISKYDLNFNFEELLKEFSSLYKPFDTNILIEFFDERLYKFFDINRSIIKSVLITEEKDYNNIIKKILALNNIVLNSHFKEYTTTFKRVANIINSIDISSNNISNINKKLLTLKEEQELYNKYESIKNREFNSYTEYIKSLFNLKPYLDNFFENVFVNDKNIQLKQNRQNLISNIYLEFKNIADIKEISI